MKRAERQYALVDLLRGARRPLSVARLAREFGVSTRTVERDIASLQVAGVPLYADHGAAGGYSILREYSLPPLNLTAAESLAVLAGRREADYFAVYGLTWGAAAVVGPAVGTGLLNVGGPVLLWSCCAGACLILSAVRQPLQRPLTADDRAPTRTAG